MDPKPRLNRERYLDVLRRMTPEARLKRVSTLTERAKQRLKRELRKSFSEADERELHRLFLERWLNAKVEIVEVKFQPAQNSSKVMKRFRINPNPAAGVR
jgi:DNA-binding PadR family transcriptional regulator